MGDMRNRYSDRALLIALGAAQVLTLQAVQTLEKRIETMTEAVQQELDDAVTVITTAVSDASAAIKDLADKLATASSLNPGDVQVAAAKLTAIAAGLESVVAAANEPITAPTPPPVAETPSPDLGQAAPVA